MRRVAILVGACAGALLSGTLAIVAAELSVRLFLPEWAPSSEERAKFWRYDSRLGWAHEPNQRGRFDNPEFSVEVAINSHGQRDDEYPVERTGKRRMLVVGDSLGWGFGVELHERFSERIENAHPDWEVINASVSGYSTDQQLLYLQDRGMAFDPDVVLLLVHPNDFDGNVGDEGYWHFKPRFDATDDQLLLRNVPVPHPTAKQRLQRYLIGQTYLGGKLYLVRDFFMDTVAQASSRQRRSSTKSEDQEMYVTTGRLLGAIDDLCKRAGATFVLVSIPMDEQRHSFLAKLAADRKIPYLSLAPALESVGSAAIFPRDGHWNPTGHATAAAAIDGFLRGLGTFVPR